MLHKNCTKKPTQVKSEEYDKCCTCSSCAIWEGKEKKLFIEYISVLGISLVLCEQSSTDPDGVFEIKHTDSEMTEIPSNLCNRKPKRNLFERYPQQFENQQHIWESIVKINFENNKISNLTDLNCLKRLDNLNMRNNKLTHVSNTSFTSLTRLRYIDFSRNLIQNIDPGILTSVHLNLFRADFSHNKMSELDVSNMLSLYPFCHIDYQSNEVTKMVNKANFTLRMTETYGPGFVTFKDNSFEEWPDFKELLNLDNLAQMGHLFSFGFDFTNIPIICDCHLENFMSLSKDIVKSVWRDYMNVTCTGPPDLANIPVGEVDPQRFICPLSAESGCQTPECVCVDLPKNNTLFINCSKDQEYQLDTLPKVPKSKYSEYVSLDISGHSLQDISNLTYLSNISMLNVSNNNLLEINNEVAKALENATVDISNNFNLHQLPIAFLQLNICTTYMKNLVIYCDCSNSQWIETWLHSKNCINKEYIFDCKIPSGDIKSALLLRTSDLDCFSNEFKFLQASIVAGAIVFLILSGMFIYTFQYELLILIVQIKQAGRNTKPSKYTYDVFLSFDDTDNNVTKWVDEKLEVNLVNAGYRVFLPGQDVAFGAERNSEVLKAVSETRNFLLILSDSYLDQDIDGMRPWTENEWKYGWYNFLRDRHKNLIVINFDHISSFDISHHQIRAFLRVGCTINFNNHNRNIMDDICKKLGKPNIPPVINQKVHDNKNPNLNISELFMEKAQNNCNDIQDTDLEANCQKPPKDFSAGSIKITTYYKSKALSQPLNGRFACYYGNNNLKKTPHIPLFKKNKHKNHQTQVKSDLGISMSFSNSHVSSATNNNASDLSMSCSKSSNSSTTNNNDLGISMSRSNSHVSSATNNNASDLSMSCSKSSNSSTTNSNDLGISMPCSESLNSYDSGFDTSSLGHFSNSKTSSIGSSRETFSLDRVNCSLSEISL